ncbi:MAG: patatin-like phospholipase family protein [Anaerolineales bacterium]|nr:patatin-like phospholipase family protein [Chloroflexota bacterium]MBL6980010.1 patatin-like phospholipase family protein [Anaerolineales bacterium]
MNKKTALVLSGGGAKGAFQFIAEKYAREEKGYQWDVIAGVSVGALNAVMLAMKKYQRLEELWWNISAEQVYKGKLNFWSMLKIVFGAKSILNNDPLRELLQAEFEPDKVEIDLRIGAVSLRTGEYVRFVPTEPGFEQAILASTAIPIVWKPVHVSAAYPDMVDGGVRNISPLGDVLDTDPDEVVIINCSPDTSPVATRPLRNALDIGLHTLEVMLNEIFITDLREFLRINHNVKEAQAAGVTLHNEKGKPYKYYDCKIIQPDDNLGDTLDFSKEAIEMRIRAGWEKARQVLDK